MTLPPSSPEPSPGADATEGVLRPASLSYSSPHTISPRHGSAARRLRITAWLMICLAFLVSWCLFDIFVVRWHHAVITSTVGRRIIHTYGDLEPIFLWKELPPVVPVFPVLLAFAGVYFLMARMVARGNRAAFTAATLVAMIHTLVAALWLLTFVVIGYALIRRALVWWELALAIAGLVISVFMVPWLMALTFFLMGGVRRK